MKTQPTMFEDDKALADEIRSMFDVYRVAGVGWCGPDHLAAREYEGQRRAGNSIAMSSEIANAMVED